MRRALVLSSVSSLLPTIFEKLWVATLHGRLPTSPGSLAHNRLSHTRPVRYETFLSNLRILRKTSNAALAALRHSHPFLTLAKRIGLEPKTYPVALNYTKNTRKHIKSLLKHLHTQRTLSKLPTTLQVAFKQLRNKMLYYRQVPNLSQTNLNEIYASQTASIERGGHPDMEFLHPLLDTKLETNWLALSLLILLQ